METFSTLAAVRKHKALIRKDISACENQLLAGFTRPLRFLGNNPNDNVRKARRILGLARTAMSIYSLVRSRKRGQN